MISRKGFRLTYLDLPLVYTEGELERGNDVSPNLLAIFFIVMGLGQNLLK